MRIWDIDAGFLNSQSLLGEHRELHGMHSIIKNGKSGYSRHPETLRWIPYLPALLTRHELLVAEMKLRGFNHQSPLAMDAITLDWPPFFIDQPAEQYRLLKGKYVDRQQGRIPLPKNIQELWASHKYSVMARDPAICKEIGQAVAAGEICFDDLSQRLVLLMRTSPSHGRLENTVSQMWGYVEGHSLVDPQKLTSSELLQEIQEKSQKYNVEYMLRSTALGELKFWCDGTTPV